MRRSAAAYDLLACETAAELPERIELVELAPGSELRIPRVTKTKPSHHRAPAAVPSGPKVPLTPEGVGAPS